MCVCAGKSFNKESVYLTPEEGGTNYTDIERSRVVTGDERRWNRNQCFHSLAEQTEGDLQQPVTSKHLFRRQHVKRSFKCHLQCS